MEDKGKNMGSSGKKTFLIKCDLSNIQEFIFNVKSEGAARALKGRSFFLKLLLQVLIKDILDGVNIAESNERQQSKISISGGNVFLKVSTKEIQYINSLQARIDQVLRHLDLNVILAYVPYADYRSSIDELNRVCRENKYKRYTSVDDFQVMDHNKVIGKNSNDFWHNLPEFIRLNDYINIGEQTQENDDLHFIKNGKEGESAFSILGHSVQFSTKQIDDESIKLEVFLESLMPSFRDKPKTFEDLVKFSTQGAQKLGVLAMDVDGLGAYFEEIESLEAHTKFDRRLNDFFNGSIRKVIDQNFKDNIYTVTSGGDDSYFVGKWDILLDLAQKINKAFTKDFQDQKLTISAALILVDKKFPVVRFAELVDDDLKKAKYEYEEEKGNICLFGEVIKWSFLEDQVSKLKNEFIKTNRWNKKELKITAGLLAKARLTAKSISNSKGVKLSDFWKMQYYLRNRDNSRWNDLSKVREHYKKYLDASTSSDLSLLEAKNYRLIFPIAARLAELETRKS